MKKSNILSILGVAIPVIIAAVSEYADITENRKQEEKLESLESRLNQLEQKGEAQASLFIFEEETIWMR